MRIYHSPEDTIENRYCIKEIIGKSNISITYAALDLKTQEKVVLKALSLKQLNDWKHLELFEREAEVLSKLNHPAIPKYLDYFHIDTEDDRTFYIVQQFAPGESLSSLVENGWRSQEGEVKNIAEQILNILNYLHNFDPPVIHRDIKPENIIRTPEGKIFLVDFGAVQNTYYNTIMQGSTVVGTYGYMSPEQFRGQAVPATDLYGLGATLLYLLTHRSPAELPEETLKINFHDHVQISESLTEWLEEMLEPDVEDRFSSANEALFALHSSPSKIQKFIIKPKVISVLILGIMGVAALSLFRIYKWTVLNALGYRPATCNINAIDNYLAHGGSVETLAKQDFMIFCAVKAGDQNLTQMLIDKGVNVNEGYQNGETVLGQAVAYGNLGMVEFLIKNGANVNLVNIYPEETPLFQAVESQNYKMVKLLLENHADSAVQDKLGQTPLTRSIKVGNLKIAELLLKKGASLPQEENLNQLSATVVGQGNTPLLEFLLDNGADVNASYGDDHLLYIAATRGYREIVELLVANGADVNIKNLHNGETPLFRAIFTRRYDIVEFLLENGAEVNIKSRYEETPLLKVQKYIESASQSSRPSSTGHKEVYLKIENLLKQYGAKANIDEIKN